MTQREMTVTWVVLTSGTSRSSGDSERDDSDMGCAYIRHVKVFWSVREMTVTWVVLTSGTSRSSGQSERDDSDMGVLTSGTSRSSGGSERDDSDMGCAYIRHVKVFWSVRER